MPASVNLLTLRVEAPVEVSGVAGWGPLQREHVSVRFSVLAKIRCFGTGLVRRVAEKMFHLPLVELISGTSLGGEK